MTADAQPGFRWLASHLDVWHSKQRDTRTDKTLQNAASATRKVKSVENGVKKIYEVPRYTAEQIAPIRYSLLLRKRLQERTQSRAIARTLAVLADHAARASDPTERI